MPSTAPYLGKGMAFPFRARSATGKTAVTEGMTDPASVALQYLNEAWTIREDTSHPENHIAEAIAHILLTSIGEHDTLPWFGSRMREILFDPNSAEAHTVISFWLQHSTERWEKRAKYGMTKFLPSGYHTDEGILPLVAYIDFIMHQVQGNLIDPFVTPRQARTQEYPAATFDASGHDYESRYFGGSRSIKDGITYSRLRHWPPIKAAADDEFYTVEHGDTWLLVAWKVYSEIRYWPYIFKSYLTDCVSQETTRHSMDPSSRPSVGTVLRIPSRARILSLVAGAGG